MVAMARLSDDSDLVLMSEFQGGTAVQLPEDVTIIRLKLVGNSSGIIEINYYKIANHRLNASQSIAQFVNSLIDDINYVTWRDPQIPHEPGPSRLSLSNKDYRYFVFILEDGNYRFSAKQYPFRVQASKHTYFFEAKCAWKENAYYKHERQAKEEYPCKHGYFLAFSNEDYGDYGNGFVSNFNIYLDLDYGRGDFVPISVDPDVGYPGGQS